MLRSLTLDAFSPGCLWRCKRTGGRSIGFISPVAEFTPKSVETKELRTSLVYRLRIVVEGDTAGLLQGMPVTALVKSGKES
jgi:HlyD family secretion protein